MFILLFAIYTTILTIFENIFLLTAVFFVVMFVIMVFFLIKKLSLRKTVFINTFAFIVVLGAVFIKNYNYTPLPLNIGNHGNIGADVSPSEEGKYFIGTGVVTSLYKDNALIFSTVNQDFILKTEKSYAIGDEIFLSSKIKAKYKPKNFFDTTKQREEFWAFNFFDNIFAYEFNYSKRLFMKDITADIQEQNSFKVSGDNTNLVQRLRIGLYDKVNTLYGENKYSGLILGMLIGDRYQIPQKDYKMFQSSGLVHIIAVSGGNVMIIVIFLGFIFFWVPFYLRKIIITGIIIVYALICGMDSSIVRATIMGLLGILAIFAGRELSIYRAMKLAFLRMLLYNPYYLVYDIGFMLSFSAIIGILLFDSWFPLNYEKTTIGSQKLKKGFLAMLYPTLGATIGVLPILLFYIGSYNILGIVANIFVLPIVGFVMIAAFVTSFVNTWLPWEFWAKPVTFLLSYIYQISELVSRYGVYFDITSLWLKYFFLIGWIVFVVWFLVREGKGSIRE